MGGGDGEEARHSVRGGGGEMERKRDIAWGGGGGEMERKRDIA